MAECQHEQFEARAEVNRLHSDGDTDPHSFAAGLRIKCVQCGVSFGFRCPNVGVLPDRPACSPDALEIRLPLIPPSELELLGPLAAMQGTSGHPGFSIRVRDEQ